MFYDCIGIKMQIIQTGFITIIFICFLLLSKAIKIFLWALGTGPAGPDGEVGPEWTHPFPFFDCCLWPSDTQVSITSPIIFLFFFFLSFIVFALKFRSMAHFKILFIYFYIYFWLCWVFVSVRGLSPVAASRGRSSSRCAGLSLSRPLLLRSTSSRRAGSVVVAHGPSCSVACGIFPDQGSNPCPLH